MNVACCAFPEGGKKKILLPSLDIVPATDTSFKVSMSPWTNYTFRVIARNKVGDSLPSGHSKTCLTPEDVPHKNPDNAEGRGTAPNNLVIYWTPMPQIEHNAPKFQYRIYWKQVNLMMIAGGHGREVLPDVGKMHGIFLSEQNI